MLQRTPPVSAQAIVRSQRPLVVLQRLSVGGDLARLVARGEQAALGVLPVLGPRVVERKHAVKLRAPAGRRLLDRPRDRLVQLTSPLEQDAVVHRLLGQDMPEQVFQFWHAPQLADEIEQLQLPEARIDIAVVLGDRLQQRTREAAPDHRCDPQ
jgi:hypothetical protein